MFKSDAPVHDSTSPRLAQLGRLRLREDVAFGDKNGKEKGRKRKAAEKAIAKLQVPLEQFISADETILYTAIVKSPISPLEQWTYGIFVHNVCLTRMVLTDRRFLNLRVAGNGTWKEIISECAWSDVTEAKVKGFISGTCEFLFKNGKKVKYWGIARQDSKVMEKLLPMLIQAAQVNSAPGVFVASLCPECASRLTTGVYQCSQCQLLFKNEKMLLRLMFIPGGVHLYCREWLLGILDIVGEGYLLIAFFGTLIALAMSFQGKSEDIAGAAVLFGFVCVLLSIDALISYAHGRRFVREFISTHKKAESATLSRGMAAGGTIG